MIELNVIASPELAAVSLATTTGWSIRSGALWEATLVLSLAGTVAAAVAWLVTSGRRASPD